MFLFLFLYIACRTHAEKVDNRAKTLTVSIATSHINSEQLFPLVLCLFPAAVLYCRVYSTSVHKQCSLVRVQYSCSNDWSSLPCNWCKTVSELDSHSSLHGTSVILVCVQIVPHFLLCRFTQTCYSGYTSRSCYYTYVSISYIQYSVQYRKHTCMRLCPHQDIEHGAGGTGTCLKPVLPLTSILLFNHLAV